MREQVHRKRDDEEKRPDGEDRLVFDRTGRCVPQADLHVSAEEVRFWNTPEEHDAIQATQVPFALVALEAYRERVKTLQPGGEVLPGVTTQALPGHTPGQIGFRVGEENPVLISADVLHLPALQVKHPEWGFLFDANKANALQTRVDLMASTSKSQG